MNIAIVGAGAMGSRFGSMLYRAGHDVLLIDEWKKHVDAIHNHGLEVTNEEGSQVCRMPASFPENSQGTFDLLIMLTKAMETERMLESCRHLIGEKTKVLTLQNGLGNVETIEKFVPRGRLYAGVTTFASRLTGPGKVEAFGSGDTEVMQVDSQDSADVREVVEVLDGAGMRTVLSENVISSIWKKAAFNSVLNPLCTLMQNTVATVGSYSNIDVVVDGLIDEIILVAEAEGVSLEKKKIKETIEGVFDPAMSGNHISSMYHDIQNGRKTEIDYMNGAIVAKAEKHHIPVPNNQLIYHLICMLEETSHKKIMSNSGS